MFMKKIYRSIIPIILIVILLPVFTTGCGKKTDLELSGTIEATQLEASSEVAGRVLRLEKDEGDAIKLGDVLAVLDSSMQELTVKQQQAVINLKEAKLEELKAGTRPQQLDQAKASVKSAKLAVTNASTSVENARTTYDYWLDKYESTKKLNAANSSTENDVADAKYKVDTAKQQLDIAGKQLESLKAQLASAQAQQDLLEKGSTSQTIKAAEADLEQSRIALEQANLTLGKYSIKAAIDGVYSIRNVNIGDIINPGTSVATISDLKDLWVNVFIPQKKLTSISNGQELDLRVKALDNGTVKGRIVHIADKAEFTPKNTETDDAKENTVFKVKIKISEKVELLKPGMTVDAIIPIK
jgi:HlyD family secretion protein